ncbi:glycosyltransferase family 2 protein [Butyrivibrio sp. VCB2006]|uniref:glycosyltransferase family 2 protein n=1 Tax=Butyrivibrio sp. VCB2006 TaxID=1280679 RepID=UPI0003F964BB|nr:glycosyltransferase family 2 protein [Butyrivibrio sp. VCB2006]
MDRELISFVIPCYKSSKTIEIVVNEIKQTMANYDYEIVLVNDSSPDDTFGTIAKLCSKDKYIVGINLNENFGQHAALMAGFNHVHGSIVVCLDDDGQTPANECLKLIDEIKRGKDVVYAKYTHKKHSNFRNFGSRVNDWMLRFMLNKPKELEVSSYFAMRRLIADEVIKYTNPFPYVIGLVLRSTKSISNIEINHKDRMEGESGYTFRKLIALWMNGFTAFSVKPLRMATAIGGIMALISFLYGIFTIVMKIVGINYVMGFSALMAVITFIGGLNLLMLGIIGEYIGRIYISLNKAPQYIIREVIDNREQGTSREE